MSLDGVPRLSHRLISRPRLVDALDAETAIVVLHAPAGYGKTIAMSQWARATVLPGVWLRIDEGGGEPGAFVGALARALEDAGHLGSGNPLSGARYAINAGADPWDLLRRGVRMIGGDVAFALDECERLDPEAALGLLEVVADVPSLVLRVATRRTNPFAEPALAVGVDLDIVSADALRLTPDEASAILGADPESVRVGDVLLHGGAPALARMIALGGGADSAETFGSHVLEDGEAASDAASVVDVVDSVLRIQRTRWSPQFATFIEAIALADRVDAELARELSGDPDSSAWLDLAESEGLGQWHPVTGSGEAVFTISPFFIRALRRLVRRRWDLPAQRSADVAVAAWEFRRGHGFAALRRAADAEAWGMVNDIISVHWHDLFRYSGAVGRALDGLTPAQLQAYPFIPLLLGVLANRRAGGRRHALDYLQWAVKGARRRMRGTGAVERATYAIVAIAACRASSQLSEAEEIARDLLRDLDDMAPADRRSMGPGYVQGYIEIGTTLMGCGAHAEALACLRVAVDAGEGLDNPIVLQAAASTVGLLALGGDIVSAEAEAADLRDRPWPPGWIGGYQGTLLELAEAAICLERGELTTAREHVQALSSRSLMEHWALLLQAEVLLVALEGDPHAALRRLDSVVASRRAQRAVGPADAARLALTRSTLALAMGDAAAALRSLPRTDGPAVAVNRARWALAVGDIAGALGLLHARDFSSTPRLRAEAACLSAAAMCLDEPDSSRAEALVRGLRGSVLDYSLRLPLLMVPAHGLDAMIAVATRTPRADRSVGMRSIRTHLLRARAQEFIGPQRRAVVLTPRERAVARELAQHESIAALASALSVSPNTVKSQLRSLYRKLGVSSQAEAVRALAGWDGTGDPLAVRVRHPDAVS